LGCSVMMVPGLATSQFLKWGYEAQGDLGTLPPSRFTISKRG